MKNLFLFILGLSMFNIKAQQAPTGNVPASNTTAQALAAWYRGGNNNSTGSNNIFGTRWNSGIYTMTNGRFRMRLNGDSFYDVNGYVANRNGYLLLGSSSGNLYIGQNAGAVSLLHLNGQFNSSGPMSFLGYRPWMQARVSFTDNNDLAYFY